MQNAAPLPTAEHRNVRQQDGWLPEIAAGLAALIGRLPALGAWWNLDDWGQLARAAGLEEGPGGWPARLLSQHLYWDLTWPLFGLNSDAHAVLRLLLHATAAVLVVRLARRSGLGSLPCLLAGLVFAASPLAFTPLYWASGIQELLAAVFALAAVERWLAGAEVGRKALVWATGLTVLSLLSKESGLGLPLLFLALAWARIGVRPSDKAFAAAMILFQLAAATGTGVLVLNHFDTGVGGNYALGGGLVPVINLGACGWWLLFPGPVPASSISPAMAAAGGALFLVWAALGLVLWRRGLKVALFALLAALLVLAPALPLRRQLVPYLAYLAVAPLGLFLAALAAGFGRLQLRGPGRLPAFGFLTLAAMAYGFLGMETRLAARNELGLVADPVARATALSWQACRTLQHLDNRPVPGSAPAAELTHVVLLQPLADPQANALAADLGERWTQPSDLHEALGGTRGPRLVLKDGVRVHWANGLTTASTRAIVLCETPTGFRYWGRTANALLYAALTDIGLGSFERARGHLKRAADLSGDQIMFIYDEGQMVVPLSLVVAKKEAFIDWTLHLLTAGVTQLEVGGLQDLFFNLLSNATGRSVAELTEGSRLLTGPREPDPDNPKE